MQLKLAYFYPDLMNIYGDNGNVLTLYRRCRWRGIDLAITAVKIGDSPDLTGYDLAFFGGGQDQQQILVAEDLEAKKAVNLRAAVEDGLVMLAVCGGFQLLGHYYRPLHGPVLKGLAIFDLYTEGEKGRAIGDALVQTEIAPGRSLLLVGFENHSGRTYLGPGCRPLGRVLLGFGNNGRDGWEGARHRNCFGTYLHGPLLPKNPAFADHLITLALERRYGRADLAPLDDTLEEETRAYVIKRLKKEYLFKRRRK